MAAPVYAIVGTRLSDADTLTGWDAGNISTDDTPKQGTGAIGAKVSGAVAAFGYTHGTQFDVSGADRRCFYAWLYSVSQIDTLANGGFRMRVGLDSANYHEYHVAGQGERYAGGFKKFAISPRVAPNTTVGTPNLTNVDYFAGVYDVISTIMGNFNNCLIDAIDLLEGLRVTDGDITTPGTFAGLRTFDTGTLANQYGVIRQDAGVFFIQGRLFIGDGATATRFEDKSGSVVVFEEQIVDTDFYEIRNTANGVFVLGELVGGAAVNGISIFSGSDLEWFLNLAAGTSSLFGSTFGQCRLVALGSGVTAQDCVFTECGTISPAGATISGGLVVGSTDVVAMQVTAPSDITNVSGVSFFGNDRAIEITTADTYTFDGLKFAGNTFDLRNSSPGLVTINVVGGGDTPSFENTGGGSVVVNNPVTYTLTNLVVGSEVTIVRTSDEAILFHVESSGTSEQHSHDGTVTAVDVLVFHVDYEPVAIADTLDSTNKSIPVQQVPDLVYSNP